jgi:hypothetical protein
VDYWILRLDADGNQLWDRSFGGSTNDYLNAAAPTREGGLILAGNSFSPAGGSKNAPFIGGDPSHGGGGDFWVVLVDTNGNKIWDKSYGGTSDDGCYAVQQTADGGFILGGWSESPPSGNKTSPNYGSGDMWIVRLDAQGNVLWDRSFGGTNGEQANAVLQTSDGGFVLGGSFPNRSNDFSSTDAWLVRLDESGNKTWDKMYGGTNGEAIYAIQQMSDGGLALGCQSSSPPSGNKRSTNYGNRDFWMVRTDSTGAILSERSYGGTAGDNLAVLQITSDAGLILAGSSTSGPGGTKTTPAFGLLDAWVVKLGPELPCLFAPYQKREDIQLAGFRLNLSVLKTNAYVMDYSTNLLEWFHLQTNRLGDQTVEIVDSTASNSPTRFYRVHVTE